jgi:hypothetical protein
VTVQKRGETQIGRAYADSDAHEVPAFSRNVIADHWELSTSSACERMDDMSGQTIDWMGQISAGTFAAAVETRPGRPALTTTWVA